MAINVPNVSLRKGERRKLLFPQTRNPVWFSASDKTDAENWREVVRWEIEDAQKTVVASMRTRIPIATKFARHILCLWQYELHELERDA